MTFLDHIERADRAAQVHLGGETVSYRPEGGDAVSVVGIFDDTYVQVDPGIGEGGEQIAPRIFLRLADLPVHPDDDDPTITIGSTDYRVRERQVDGVGGITLLLRRAS